MKAMLALESPAPDPYDALGKDYGRFIARLGSSAPRPGVNLLMPEYAPTRVFAGLRTAVTFAEAVAADALLPLRIVPFAEGPLEYMRSRLGRAPIDARRTPLRSLQPAPDDIWIATMWHTAAALRVAAHRGLIDPGRVIYLIQDFEPGFYPWSSNYALAVATYKAGFTHVVNSRPLASYLRRTEGVDVSDDLILAPVLDTVSLRRVAATRTVPVHPTVFFYARPSKPRNLFELGCTSLAMFADRMRNAGHTARIITAGESHRALNVSPNVVVDPRGRVTWDAYYKLLGEADVALALMESPHPSHPPLDFALAGARVITNAFGDYRSGVHPNIRAVDANPETLADSLVAAVDACCSEPLRQPEPLANLGGSLDSVLAALPILRNQAGV